MIGYLLVWLGTLISVSLGFIFGRNWIDKRLAKKPAQKQGVTVP